MNQKQYIRSRFQKILKESIHEKSESIINKLNLRKEVPFNPAGESFDYVQEGETCECGGEMYEGECMECGSKGSNSEIMELGGMDDGHPKFGNKNLSKLSKKEIESLLNKHGEEDDDEFEEFDFTDYGDDDDFEELDIETDWSELEENEECMECGSSYEMKEKLYGRQHKLDRNKNNRIDREDFEMLRNKRKPKKVETDEQWQGIVGNMAVAAAPAIANWAMDKVFNEGEEYDTEQLYEIEFEKQETDEGNAFTGALSKAKKQGDDSFEVDGKKYEVTEKWKGKGKSKVNETILFTETDLINFIEKIVNEEKKFKVEEPKGYREYERAHKADKKENEDYLKSVAKKMTDYLKGASDSGSKYEMKETKKFPTENGGMKKGNRKKYTPSDAVDEYIDAFSYPGQTNLVYDEVKPNDKWIEDLIKGSSRTGNAQVDKDGNALGNVVPSKTGDKFYKNFQDNLYGQEQMNASYKRQPQPVDQAGEHTERGSLKSKKGKKTSQTILNKVDESTNVKKIEKLNEEFDRIQSLMGYNRKTQ